MRFPIIINHLFFLGLITLQSVSAEGNPFIFVDVFGGYQSMGSD